MARRRVSTARIVRPARVLKAAMHVRPVATIDLLGLSATSHVLKSAMATGRSAHRAAMVPRHVSIVRTVRLARVPRVAMPVRLAAAIDPHGLSVTSRVSIVRIVRLVRVLKVAMRVRPAATQDGTANPAGPSAISRVSKSAMALHRDGLCAAMATSLASIAVNARPAVATSRFVRGLPAISRAPEVRLVDHSSPVAVVAAAAANRRRAASDRLCGSSAAGCVAVR
jgi:hypothetical protein